MGIAIDKPAWTDESQTIFDPPVLVGPQGETGPQGPQGVQGPAGTDGVGVPAGGTAGQVLAKIDGTDYNTQWVDQTGGSGGVGLDSVFMLMGG